MKLKERSLLCATPRTHTFGTHHRWPIGSKWANGSDIFKIGKVFPLSRKTRRIRRCALCPGTRKTAKFAYGLTYLSHLMPRLAVSPARCPFPLFPQDHADVSFIIKQTTGAGMHGSGGRCNPGGGSFFTLK